MNSSARRPPANGKPPGQAAPEAVDSATVLLVRQAPPTDLEVLLLRRHTSSKAFPGDFVFPGGTVDEHDAELDPSLWSCTGLPAVAGRFTQGSHPTALGLLVTAVRETFEEAGVLLARRRDGTPVSDLELSSPSFTAARRHLNRRGEDWDWATWLEEEQLVLDLDALGPWAWWVTPVHLPYRFDTRFFLAHLPPGQSATHDGTETTSMRWTAPQRALEDCREGHIHMRNPTRQNLKMLSKYRSPDEAVEAVRSGDVDLRRVQPRVVRCGEDFRVEHSIGEPPQTTIP